MVPSGTEVEKTFGLMKNLASPSSTTNVRCVFKSRSFFVHVVRNTAAKRCDHHHDAIALYDFGTTTAAAELITIVSCSLCV